MAVSPFLTYVPVDETAVNWQLYCTTAGCNDVEPKAPYPARAEHHPAEYTQSLTDMSVGRVLPEFQLIYITRGAGAFRSAYTKEHKIRGGTAFFLFPGVRHAFLPAREKGWDEYWVGFSGAYARTILENGFLETSRPVIELGMKDRLLEEFHRVFELAERRPAGYQLKLGAVVMNMLADVVSAPRELDDPSDSLSLMKQARFLFTERIYQDISVEAVARQLGISGTSFHNLFKRYAGVSPYQYFLGMKIERAKQLLQEHGATVKDVAFTMGFADQYYFSRLFKRKTGRPPSSDIRA